VILLDPVLRTRCDEGGLRHEEVTRKFMAFGMIWLIWQVAALPGAPPLYPAGSSAQSVCSDVRAEEPVPPHLLRASRGGGTCLRHYPTERQPRLVRLGSVHRPSAQTSLRRFEAPWPCKPRSERSRRAKPRRRCGGTGSSAPTGTSQRSLKTRRGKGAEPLGAQRPAKSARNARGL
jgi:hypothetical protein